jgi:hypothetical protein
METVKRKQNVPTKSGLVMRNSRSSGSKDGDGFYPKTPETRSTDEERPSGPDSEAHN